MEARTLRRVELMVQHLTGGAVQGNTVQVSAAPCLNYLPPEANRSTSSIDPVALRQLLDMDADILDHMFGVFAANRVFWPQENAPAGGHLYTQMDYNSTKEDQRTVTMKRILFLRDRGYFKDWLTTNDVDNLRRKAAMHQAIGYYDHSMGIKLGVHIHLWGGAVKYLGTERHHRQWLKKTEDYEVAGCFALTELGHGSNVRGIETVATFDAVRGEFIINTPCESAQKFWIGGAAQHATHTVCFAQLHIGGKNEGVHAFVVQLREGGGACCQGVRIADCGHKIGLNGVDNGRIWFDHVRIPRENILNAVADVTPEGKYTSPITDPDQRFAAFMSPLTGGRVTIAVSAVDQCKTGLSIALRYSLSRKAFALNPGEEEVLLLDYPTHQRRLLPLLAKTYALNFACNALKGVYLHRTPSDAKLIHVMSSGYKAMCSWHMLRTLQEAREACGGQGIRSDNRIGQLKAEHDVMATFEGDNNVLMQTVSKAILGDYLAAVKKGRGITGMGLEHCNNPKPNLPSQATSRTFRDGNFQVGLFQLRERDLLEQFAAEVMERRKEGAAMADALNQSYQVATDLGKAHAERQVLEAILLAAKTASPAPNQEAILLMASLHFAATVDEDNVFLRNGYITQEQAKGVHKEVAVLCGEMRPHTLALVEGMGVPKHLLGPIAFDWVDFYSWKNETVGKGEEVVQLAQV